MNRRKFLGRVLGGIGAATLGAGTAMALVKNPEAGQRTILPSRIHDKDVNVPWPKEEWWERPVEWLGDPLDHNWPLSWWANQGHTPEVNGEFSTAMEFYLGRQWPEASLDARGSRPTLTINYIKPIVDRAILVSRERGESIDLISAGWRCVFVNVVRRNRDPQIHYNALNSARLEMLMFERSKPKWIGSNALMGEYTDKADPYHWDKPPIFASTYKEKGHTFYEFAGHIPSQAGIRTYSSDNRAGSAEYAAPNHLL